MRRKSGPKPVSLVTRLIENSKPSGECILWTGSKTKDGYGVLGIGRNNQQRAHRVAWEVKHGPIPEGLQVCHKCDVPLCINIAHLFLGTAKENRADMIRKGRTRAPRGEAHPAAKLTAAQVRTIRKLRASGMKLTEIASRFGIVFQHVSNICSGRHTWKSPK